MYDLSKLNRKEMNISNRSIRSSVTEKQFKNSEMFHQVKLLGLTQRNKELTPHKLFCPLHTTPIIKCHNFLVKKKKKTKLLTNQSPSPNKLTTGFCRNFRNKTPKYPKCFHKIKRDRTLPNYFYKASINSDTSTR